MGHVVLPVGVNPNTQIMGSNCEGSERAKLLCRLSVRFGAAGCAQREREGGGVLPRHASLPLSSPSLLSLLTVDSRRGGERGRREDRNRVIGTKS